MSRTPLAGDAVHHNAGRPQPGPAMRAGERSGWRDEGISRRHRRWGFACLAVDVDFLLVEHHVGMPVALVEYKHHLAAPVALEHPTYLALAALADRPPAMPFIIARYWPDLWAFRVTPANLAAYRWFDGTTDLSEAEWVDVMHRMRAVTVQHAVGRNLNQERPPAAA